MKQDHPELRDAWIIRLMVDDQYRVLRHALLLLGTMAVLYFSNEISDYSGFYKYFRLMAVYVPLITLSYINMNVLVLRLFFKGRYILYLILLLLLVLACLMLVDNLLNTFFITERLSFPQGREYKARGFYKGMIVVFPIILLSTMIKLFQRWVRDNQRITELRNITLTMELNELRNQINPHFLFNMLNGIKALVRSDPEKATIVIMKLSEFLRYQLYENNDERTTLHSEISFLSNFLDLEKLRRDHLSVEIRSGTTPSILNRIVLPANLFTTFVENAVKHSVDISGAGAYIRVNIAVDENKLRFSCVNSKDPAYRPSAGRNSGLGLVNIKRRLGLLYGDHYVLETTSTEREYNVELTIPI